MLHFAINTRLIVFLLMFAYVSAISIEAIYNHEPISSEAASITEVDQEYHLVILFSSFVCLIAFSAGYSFSWLSKLEKVVPSRKKRAAYKRSNFNYFLLGYWVFLAGIGWLVFRNEFYISFLSYSDNVEISYNNSTFSFYKTILYSYSAITAALLVYTRFYIPAILLCAFLFWMGVETSDKDPIVLSILSLGSSNALYNRRISLGLLTFIAASFVLLLFFSKVYSFYRGAETVPRSIERAYEEFSFMELDGSGPYLSIQYVMADDGPLEYGSTYLRQLVTLVPKMIYKDRPPDVADLFAQKTLTHYFGGRGVGYSPIADAYTNFGFIGLPVQFFLQILLFSFVWWVTAMVLMNLSPIKRTEVVVIYRVIGFYQLLLLLRSPSLFFIKAQIYLLFPLLLGVLIWALLPKKKKLVAGSKPIANL